MDNRSVEEALRYHETTKLRTGSPPEVHGPDHTRSKSYIGGEVTRLECNVPLPDIPTLDALANTEFDEDIEVDIAGVSQILHAAVAFMRQAGSATEVYLIATEIPGLASGVYHLDPDGFGLTRLRDGDYRPDLVATAGDNQSLAAAPVTFVLTAPLVGTYRTLLTNAGRVAAGLLVAASATRLAASVEMSFVDPLVNRLLGLDGESEAALCLMPLGRVLDWAEHVGERTLPQVRVAAEREASKGPVDARLARIHAASCIASNEETRPLRGPCPRPGRTHKNDMRLDCPTAESRLLGEILFSDAGSGYTAKEMDARALFAIMHHATGDLPADFLEGPETSLIDSYLLAHRIQGLEPGLYSVHPATRGLARIRSGDLRAGFERNLAPGPGVSEPAAHLILTSDFGPVLERFGNRGYRLMQVEAGVAAARIGLAAGSIGFGASMLPFFDDAMTGFLHPEGGGGQALLTLALG